MRMRGLMPLTTECQISERRRCVELIALRVEGSGGVRAPCGGPSERRTLV